MTAGPRLAIICGIAAALSAGVLPLAAQLTPRDAFAVGVLRRDGIIVPFGTYDGTRWRSSWPEPQDKVDVPIDLRNVPAKWWGPTGPLDTWQVWLASGPPRSVRVRQPDWVQVECRRQIGLRTDYQTSLPPPEPDAQPYPKDGLAVSPAHPIERIEIVPPGPTPPAVLDAFKEAEERALRDSQSLPLEWRAAAGKKQREQTPLNIEAEYAYGDQNATRLHYYEGSRQYTTPGASDCPTIALGSGWFIRDGAGPLRKLSFMVVFRNCDRNAVLYMLPLGVVRLPDRAFWIAQWSGWDHEEFDVIEINAKGIERVLQVSGGTCADH